eukprot:scaffold21126_cov62-Phaeocystis_antarctica.AAC.4
MLVTLEVSKLSGWLNANVYCRESKGGHAVRGEGAGQQTGVQRAGAGSAADMGQGTGRSAPGTSAACSELVVVKGVRRKQRAGGASGRRLRAQGRRGAHPEHLVHVCDARGFPAGNVRIEVFQVGEEVAHVGDA